jgi:S-adenosyl-L-methionine hydrolase (adenosine-forming)
VTAIVTLTTDFGTRDPYVAAMKGVILGIARDARLVDATHEIAPHDVTEGALALEAIAPWFPPGTVHLAVVDPGVGTARRGLVVVRERALFVGPDNGLFTPFLDEGGWGAFELVAPAYRLREVSTTFHGRDVFAPAAAHLAQGVAPERLGPAVADPVRLPWPTVREATGAVAGTVLHVDRFGNLVTSIRADAFGAWGGISVRMGGKALPFVSTYGDLEPGQPGALVGGSGRLEIAVREGSAAVRLKASRGTPVVVSRSSPVRRVKRRL